MTQVFVSYKEGIAGSNSASPTTFFCNQRYFMNTEREPGCATRPFCCNRASDYARSGPVLRFVKEVFENRPLVGVGDDLGGALLALEAH